MAEWQPIETAPRDGTLIRLTWMDGGEPQDQMTMRYSPIQRNGLFPGVVGMWVAPDASMTWNEADPDGAPTHWRPLPEPPK